MPAILESISLDIYILDNESDDELPPEEFEGIVPDMVPAKAPWNYIKIINKYNYKINS